MELYDTQGRLITYPGIHATMHQDGGADEISIASLAGSPAQKGVASGLASLNASIKVVEQPASISDFLDNTAGGTDALVTKAPTSNVMYDHALAVLSTTIHNNNNYFLGYGDETVAALLTDTSPQPRIRVPSLTALTDPTNGLVNGDWYGASGAYEQADAAGCSATNIRDTSKSAAFTASLAVTLVKWASNAAGTTDTGYGSIAALVDANNLTIAKMAGTDFANSYYYWIKHSEWTVPVTGIYLIKLTITYQPAEVDKGFYAALYAYAAGSAPSVRATQFWVAPIALSHQVALIDILSLTAGQFVISVTGHIGTSGTPTLLADPVGTAIQMKLWLLKQTA